MKFFRIMFVLSYALKVSVVSIKYFIFMIDKCEQEDLLKCLEGYFHKNNNESNKIEFQMIEDILKSDTFTNKVITVDDVIRAVHEDPDIRFSVRGFKIRPKPLELNNDPEIILSKKMAAILRHGLHRSGLEIHNGCYVKVSDLLNLSSFREFTREDIEKVVNTNGKRRYEIISKNSDELIAALQGHTVAINNTSLVLLSSCDVTKLAYHGTFYSNWESIKANGLKKMGRDFIHLYTSESRETIRDGAEIVIEVDVERAIKDGMRFFKAKNNILLCEGENGILKPNYFVDVWDIKTKKKLFVNSKSQCEVTSPIPMYQRFCRMI